MGVVIPFDRINGNRARLFHIRNERLDAQPVQLRHHNRIELPVRPEDVAARRVDDDSLRRARLPRNDGLDAAAVHFGAHYRRLVVADEFGLTDVLGVDDIGDVGDPRRR